MTKPYAIDRDMPYEEAEYWCRIEAEQCTCRWNEESGMPIHDGCLWHSEAARREGGRE